MSALSFANDGVSPVVRERQGQRCQRFYYILVKARTDSPACRQAGTLADRKQLNNYTIKQLIY